MAELDLLALLERHVELFNDAVASGDFAPLLATFAPDAVMSFDDVPLGPYRGLVEIRNAFATRTFTDTMALIDMEKVGPDAVTASFEWDAGGTGQMYLRWQEDDLVELVELRMAISSVDA